MVDIINDRSTRSRNQNGSWNVKTFLGPIYFINDNSQWEEIVPGSKDKIADNCEIVEIPGGYRMWKPNPAAYITRYIGPSEYFPVKVPDPEWLEDGDFWLDVTDEDDITGYTWYRNIVTEQARLLNPQSEFPVWRWIASDNLTRFSVNGGFEWRDEFGNVIFTKEAPKAWSESNIRKVVTGTASINNQGYVTINIDLDELSYPIILDPSLIFGSDPDDFLRYNSTAPANHGGSNHAAWEAARSRTLVGSDGEAIGTTQPYFYAGSLNSVSTDGVFYDEHAGVPFNLTGFGLAGLQVTAAKLWMHRALDRSTTATDVEMHLVQGLYSSPPVLGDWPDRPTLDNAPSFGFTLANVWADNNYYAIVLNNLGIAAIDTDGITQFLIMDQFEKDDIDPIYDYTGSPKSDFIMESSVGDHPPYLELTLSSYSQVILKAGLEPDIIGESVLNVNSGKVTCVLPITGANPGLRDVYYENPGNNDTLPGAFLITSGEQPPEPTPLPGTSSSVPSDSIKHILSASRFVGSTVLDTTNETGKIRLQNVATLRDTFLSVFDGTSKANVHLNTSAGNKLKAIAALNPNTATAADIINAVKNS